MATDSTEISTLPHELLATAPPHNHIPFRDAANVLASADRGKQTQNIVDYGTDIQELHTKKTQVHQE